MGPSRDDHNGKNGDECDEEGANKLGEIRVLDEEISGSVGVDDVFYEVLPGKGYQKTEGCDDGGAGAFFELLMKFGGFVEHSVC